MNNSMAKSVKICCNNCKHEFLLKSVDINEAIVDVNGQALKLVYFACSKCNTIYRIALEDEKSEELKADLVNTKNRMQKVYDSGNKEFARTLSEMILKKLNRLKSHSKNLDKKYPGTFTFVASENNNEEKIIKYLP